MDINYYLHREQIERVRAAAAECDEARAAHCRMADIYRERIEGYRNTVAAAARRNSAMQRISFSRCSGP